MGIEKLWGSGYFSFGVVNAKMPGIHTNSSKQLFTIIYKLLNFFLVILHEGEVCPFIGFIKSGHCEIFKSVDAVKTLPNNQKVLILLENVIKMLLLLSNIAIHAGLK